MTIYYERLKLANKEFALSAMIARARIDILIAPLIYTAQLMFLLSN